MNLTKFDGVNKNELSMIEVAHEILKERADVMPFADLTNAVQQFLGKSDEEIRTRLTQFYTDLNIDGSFICLGDNVWGLRSWYPFDSIDEALVHSDEEEDEEDLPRKKHKRVNAFLVDVDDDDDIIDYNDDDPEDDDLDVDYEESEDDEDNNELKHYSNDLDDIDEEDEEELPDGIEGQLTEISDDELDVDY